MSKMRLSHKEYKARLLENPDIRKEYEVLSLQYKLIREFLSRRNELEITQVQLAKKIGTKQTAISRLENGYSNITMSSIWKIADALDLDLDISVKPRIKAKVPS